jgi:hypothetical protein
MKKLFISLIMLFVLTCLFSGCSYFEAPESFTPKQKMEYTTLRTLTAAKKFRVFALGTTAELYKKGLLTEEQKEDIIKIGDALQGSINTTAGALILYHKGAATQETVNESIEEYQSFFNDFLELVSPYL